MTKWTNSLVMFWRCKMEKANAFCACQVEVPLPAPVPSLSHAFLPLFSLRISHFFSARRALLPEQVRVIKDAGDEFLDSDLEKIEKVGGGSARCMMAEIYWQVISLSKAGNLRGTITDFFFILVSQERSTTWTNHRAGRGKSMLCFWQYNRLHQLDELAHNIKICAACEHPLCRKPGITKMMGNSNGSTSIEGSWATSMLGKSGWFSPLKKVRISTWSVCIWNWDWFKKMLK